MPVYNVEGYLAEAVGSVLSQSYRNIEIILVDDGSTDSSGAMCDEFARNDKRVRVIHKRNAGLGAARNTGIAAARGRYLVFIDSDDYVLPGAYEALIASMRKSGSDLATGNVMRRQGNREYQAWNQSRSHATDRRGIHLGDNPELVFDTVAWNKVFRRKFFLNAVASFPVDKLYEDIVPIFTAFMRAKSIDVLSRPVYVWRLRDEGDSITQRLHEARNIGDRFEMIDKVDALIRANHVAPAVADRLILKILEGDLWIYVREMDGADEQTIERIEQVVKRYWPNASDRAISLIPADRRVAYWLFEHDRTGDVEAFRKWYADVREAPPLGQAGVRVVLDTSKCPVALENVPPAILDMDSAAESIANVTAVRWSEPTVLSVFGYAYTRYLSDGGQHIELVATEIYGARSVVLPVVRVPSPESARWAGDVSSAHDFDGFRCDIDVAAEWTGPMAGSREWSFAVSVTDGEVVRTTELTKIWLGGSAAVVGAAVLSDGTLAMAKTDKGQPLRLQFERNGLFASTFTLNGSQLTVEFSAAETQAPSGVVLVVSGDTDIRTARQTRQGLFTVELPRAAVGTPTTWRAYALVGGRRVPILAPASFPTAAEPNESGLRAVVTRMRRLVVEGRYRTAVIDSIRYTKDGELEVTGALFALTDLGLGLGPGSGAPDQWVDAHIADGRFDAWISATRPDLSGVVRPLRSGSYALCGRADNGEDVTVVVSDSAAVELPSEYLDDFIKIKLERRSWARVGVQIAAPVATEMLGRYQRQRVIAQCSTSPRELETAVFFCVDLGGSVADSGLALHRELRRRRVRCSSTGVSKT